MSAHQLTLEEFAGHDDAPETADADRCEAITKTTSSRCQHPTVPGMRYCVHHLDWDDLDTATSETESE